MNFKTSHLQNVNVLYVRYCVNTCDHNVLQLWHPPGTTAVSNSKTVHAQNSFILFITARYNE